MQKSRKRNIIILASAAIIILVAAGIAVRSGLGNPAANLQSPPVSSAPTEANNQTIRPSSSTPLMASTIPPAQVSPLRTVTLSDADLPEPPVKGMAMHFIGMAEGDPGPGKIKASYGLLSYAIWFGVTDGKLWIYHLPKKENLPASLQKFYDSLGIDSYTTYNEEQRKYWLEGLPAWLDVAKYDPEVKNMPLLEAVESGDGQVTISYRIE
jgi:hypothetical protein